MRVVKLSAVAIAIVAATQASAQNLDAGTWTNPWIGAGVAHSFTGDRISSILGAPDGRLFVAERNQGTRLVIVDPAGPTAVSANAGGASSQGMRQMQMHPTDANAIVGADHNRIVKVDFTTGAVTPMVGLTSAGYQEGSLTSNPAAQFQWVYGLDRHAASGYWYASEYTGNRIRRITSNGAGDPDTTSLFAGSAAGASGYTDDATGTAATFTGPRMLAVRQSTGDIYVGEVGNTAGFRTVSSAAAVSTNTAATRTSSFAITQDEAYVYVTEFTNNRIRRLDLSGGTSAIIVGGNGAATTTSSTSASWDGTVRQPMSLTLSADGAQLYSTNWEPNNSNSIGRLDLNVISTTTPPPPPTTTTTTTTTAAPTPACDCDSEKLEVIYTSDAIPDATADAISNISLDTDTWEVVFEVRNVRAIKNGHVIAAAVNTQETAANAFTPLVSAFDANNLWQPEACGLGGIDTPAANLKVRTEWDNAACRTKYEMRYSLIDANARDDTYCDLTDDNAGNIKVNCSIVLSSVRAYASTELTAFTAQEAAFAAELNLGTYLNNEVTDLLHATMAKCSVKNGPLYVVDCRVPGVWNFDQSAFSVVQEPAGWINGASCASNVVGSDAATAATFIRCNIENDAPIANVQRALANITGTPTGNPSNALTFDVDFIVPRKVTTTASASLASFVQTIEMKDGRYFYGTADVATLEITVVDTARLSMTALELFNSVTPTKQVYDIFPGTSDARFQTALNADATKFTIDFYPAAIREDSAFYRFGPHGINVSFTFSAARRVTGGGTGGAGNVLVEGLNVEGTEATTSSGAQGSAASSSSGTALMAGVAVGAAVLVAGLVGAAVVAVKRRNNAAEQKEQL